MYKVVFLRHGESIWNYKHIFTGWTDIDLTKNGINQSKKAGKIMEKRGFKFDIAYTSYQKRAINTLKFAMQNMNCKPLIIKDWVLNERHYGALQGFSKSEMERLVGKKQVRLWRRSYDERPPLLTIEDLRWPGNDKLYKGIDKNLLPFGESLKDVVDRVDDYWDREISSQIKKGKSVIIVAHGNSLRALSKYIENMNNQEILNFDIPVGIPLVYEFDKNLKFVRRYYLKDEVNL